MTQPPERRRDSADPGTAFQIRGIDSPEGGIYFPEQGIDSPELGTDSAEWGT